MTANSIGPQEGLVALLKFYECCGIYNNEVGVQSVRAMNTRGWFVVRSVPGRRDGTPSGIRVRRWYHRRGSQGSDGRYTSPPSPIPPAEWRERQEKEVNVNYIQIF
jgi:hypothetical protein